MTKAATPEAGPGGIPPFLPPVLSGQVALDIPVWGRRVLEKDWGFRSRAVDAHVVYYVLQGGLSCRDGLHDHRIGPGGLLWIPPGRVHDLKATARPTEAYYMRVQFSGGPEGWDEKGVRTRHSRTIQGWFEAMAPLLGGNFPSGQAPWRLACLLALVYGDLTGAEAGTGQESGIAHRGLERALGWATVAEPGELTVARMAREAGVGADRLSRLMGEETGMPPRLWLVKERLRRAKGLLEETREPVGRVAALCGWENPLLFSRMFRKAFGVSPRGWRGR